MRRVAMDHMNRRVLPLLSFALGVLIVGSVRTPIVGHAAAIHTRHVGVAGGTISRAISIVTSSRHVVGDSSSFAREQLARRGAGTYIRDILGERDSSVIRWPDRHGVPLTVWVQPTSRVRDFDTIFARRARAAFVEWNDVHLPVSFAFVADSAVADVHVAWIDRFDEPISGSTRWSDDDDFAITDASITLAVHHSHGQSLEPDAVEAMTLHEVGHLLGLDHTTDTLSVMAPYVRVRELSDADRATARLLYALPIGPLR
jgi:hypothetical protein